MLKHGTGFESLANIQNWTLILIVYMSRMALHTITSTNKRLRNRLSESQGEGNLLPRSLWSASFSLHTYRRSVILFAASPIFRGLFAYNGPRTKNSCSNPGVRFRWLSSWSRSSGFALGLHHPSPMFFLLKSEPKSTVDLQRHDPYATW
jgi:hypothetical protein